MSATVIVNLHEDLAIESTARLELSSRDGSSGRLRVVRSVPLDLSRGQKTVTIDNSFVNEGDEVMLKLLLPTKEGYPGHRANFRLYKAELVGAECPAEIYDSTPSFCL